MVTEDLHSLPRTMALAALALTDAPSGIRWIACGESGIVHGAKCIAVLTRVPESLRRLRWFACDSASTRQSAPVRREFLLFIVPVC